MKTLANEEHDVIPERDTERRSERGMLFFLSYRGLVLFVINDRH